MPNHESEPESSNFHKSLLAAGAGVEGALNVLHGLAHIPDLPLGGSHMAQAGIIFSSMIVLEGLHILHHAGTFKAAAAAFIVLLRIGAYIIQAAVNGGVTVAKAANVLVTGIAKRADWRVAQFRAARAQRRPRSGPARRAGPPPALRGNVVPVEPSLSWTPLGIAAAVGRPVLSALHAGSEAATKAGGSLRRGLIALELVAVLTAYQPARL